MKNQVAGKLLVQEKQYHGANNIRGRLESKRGIGTAIAQTKDAEEEQASSEDGGQKKDGEATRPAVGTLTRTKSLLLAALRVWELKQGIGE